MIMIIAIIYIFLSYVIFDQQLKITFRKSSTHPPIEKIHSPFLLGGGGEDTVIRGRSKKNLK